MTSISALLLDIKCYIASFDESTWYLLYRYDPDFSVYAHSEEGCSVFKRIFNTMIINIFGDQEWRLLNRIHREPINGIQLPAIIGKNDIIVAFYMYGKRHHNIDHPALIIKNVSKSYYKNDLVHRDDDIFGKSQPAVIYQNGSLEYYKYGKLHRNNDPETGESLPAKMDLQHGRISYYKNGVLCRDNDINNECMPAVIYVGGLCQIIEDGLAINYSIDPNLYHDTVKKLKPVSFEDI